MNDRRLRRWAGRAGEGCLWALPRTMATPSQPPLPSQGEGSRQKIAAEAAPARSWSGRLVARRRQWQALLQRFHPPLAAHDLLELGAADRDIALVRSEERRVGKECVSTC